jgi:chlorite dismutase
MDRRRPPQTEEGWYVLHDLRTVDWDAWRNAPDRERERAIEEGIEYLDAHEAVADADAGGSATFSVLGHGADLLCLHLRPSMADLDAAARRFEHTALAGYTDRADSYVSVTEVSGYMSEAYFEGKEVEDRGTARYIESRLEPEIPDAEHVSFYPMDKRRDPEYNWYDLPFAERAELMSGHGEIGREYAGEVTQIISASTGFDDHEWGVTLFADDPGRIKTLLAEMRFDPSSSRYAEFGSFYFGRRFPPEDLGALLAGEPVPTGEGDASPHASGHAHGGAHDDGATGAHEGAGTDGTSEGADDIRGELEELDVYAGQPHGEDVHAVVLYSAADPATLGEEVSGLRESFEHYDTHVETAVYENPDGGDAAVVSIWETASGAETAGGFLADLPGVVARAGERERTDRHAGEEPGFGTMGMFYTTKPEHREAFVERFGAVEDLLDDVEGHVETDLLVDRENENDMFIASQWRSREDAMDFFRSEAFRETVSWGRDVLADRPRHVFLA